ncbi:GH92 family glycosyl hydrolase [Pedobacter psychroterrae]|uniref:Glycoside hydrolase family 92 protein n=1 Tax=Pedobacter psychroterrae TaxID=2530453 RepID=A0A4R0NHN8_9SPHI|nr:GH92 family glycosyl hydrolase [Pedobacter psychroterrae]TCC98284.1 glycoside hydrolase family 92 protein [Pedobacter psychroterrae]
MYRHTINLAVLVLLLPACSLKRENVLKYVDPNIGTAHSRWFFYTPAALPHGMAKLAPSTNGHYGNPTGWEAVGYDTRHNSIEGFVHFHEWQIGGVSVMPANGLLKLRPGKLEDEKRGTEKTGYRSMFDRKNEIAEPGYYSVLLDDYHIKAELTATERVGFHRYTFPKKEQSRIILDIGNKQGESAEVTDASVKMTDDTHFEGFVTTYPSYIRKYDPKGQISMYFYGEISKKPKHVGAFKAKTVTAESNVKGELTINPNSSSATGKGAGLYLEYSTAEQETIELKIGLSYTSVENAKINLETESKGLSFDKARQQAQEIWQRELSKLYVSGPDHKQKVKFYTGLYHALLGRGIASDVNGYFPKYDNAIGRLPLNKEGKPNYNFYNTDAIWGAFWNLTQLWALSYPDRYKDYVQTQLEVYKNRGWFGDGISNGQFTSGVGTNFVGLAVAAAYNSGIRDYDINLAYKAIRENEVEGTNRPEGSGKIDVEAFMKNGYVPFLEQDITDTTGSRFSASHTLEYSYSAFAAAQMAKSLGKMDDYQLFSKKSEGWKLLFNTENKLIQPKNADGSFIDKFDQLQPWRGFQEGNAVQYTFYVPHDPAGLIAKMGKEEFNNRLDGIFQTAQKNGFGGGKTIDAFAGIRSNYNHGNQPNLHVSWLFNFSGKPWLTQKWTRAICDEFYGTESIHGYGYGQDEDQGQLGSWYVMASLGLFDVKGFTDLRPIVEFGSPVFAEAEIRLGDGKTLLIKTVNGSADNVYVQSATFNGKALENCWMYRDELMKGGRLEFVMAGTPNVKWGIKDPPPSTQ